MTAHNSRTFTVTALMATALLIAGCSSSASTRGSSPAARPDRSPISSSAAVPARTSAAPDGTTAVPDRTSTAASSDGSAGLVSACTLVTESEISRVLGADPGPGRKFASHGSSQCQYGSYETRFVLVNLTPTRGRAGYDLMHKNSKLREARAQAVDIPGVGDRALEVSGPGTAGIYFNKGDALVVVSVVIHTAASPPTGQAFALAKIAAGRL